MNRNTYAAYDEGERQRKRRRVRFSDDPPAATVGEAFEWTPLVEGGVTPYTLTVDAGALPSGLALDAGVVSGTPDAAGAAEFWLKAVDSGTRTHSKRFTISVNEA